MNTHTTELTLKKNGVKNTIRVKMTHERKTKAEMKESLPTVIKSVTKKEKNAKAVVDELNEFDELKAGFEGGINLPKKE